MIIRGRYININPFPDDSSLPFIQTINAMQGAVTDNSFIVGAKMESSGDVRLVVYSDSGRTSWVKYSDLVESDSNGYVKFEVSGLSPNVQYYWSINSGGQKGSVQGKMKTLGTDNYIVVAASCAGNRSSGGVSNHPVFSHIESLNPASVIHMGDIFYEDINTNNPSLFDAAYDEVLSKSNQQLLYKNIPFSLIWDDHDYGGNDSNASSPSREAAISTYKNRVPHYPLPFTGSTDPICHKFDIGKVRYFNLDTRSQRVVGTTFLGSDQKQWLKDELLSVPQDYVICLQVNVPWISSSSTDTWYGVPSEKSELMTFFANNNLDEKMFMLAGDAHMCAIDDGTNNSGIPIFQFAAFDCNGSTKGGPYSHGTFPNIDDAGQFGVLDVSIDGNGINITGTGKRFINGTGSDLVSYSKVFNI